MKERPFKVGIASPFYDVIGRTMPIKDYAAGVVRAEQLGFDSAWISDHYWTDLHAPAGRHGQQEPFTALAYTAALTSTIELGIATVCPAFRSVGQLARTIISTQDAAGGRLIVGMGAGWNDAEYRAFGYDTKYRVSRLEEQLAVLPQLLNNEKVDYHGKFVDLTEAQFRHTAPPTKLWVAATNKRMLNLAARYGDGWNVAWFGPDTSIFERALTTLREEQATIDRDPDELEITVGLRVMPVDGDARSFVSTAAEKLKPRDENGVSPEWWASPIETQTIGGSDDQIVDAIGRYRELGATHVIITLSPTPFIYWDPEYIERLASLLPQIR